MSTRLFTKHKETKGTWRYQEVEDDLNVTMSGTIYFRKDFLRSTFGKVPDNIEVSISERNDLGAIAMSDPNAV